MSINSVQSIQSKKSESLLFLAVYPEVSKGLSPEDKARLAQVSRLWRMVVKEGSIPALLKHPEKNCTSPLAPFFLEHFPYLEECSCVHATEKKRDEMTQQLVNSVGPNTGASKVFVLQSVGCGGCLRELILSIYLHDAGVQCLHMILIDPARGIMINNWMTPQKLACQKKPNPGKTMNSLARFFQLFLPRFHVHFEWHCSSVKEYVSSRINLLKPDILLLVDIDCFSHLEQSFDSLRKAGALADSTLIGWTQTGIVTNSQPQSFVKPVSDIKSIKE